MFLSINKNDMGNILRNIKVMLIMEKSCQNNKIVQNKWLY